MVPLWTTNATGLISTLGLFCTDLQCQNLVLMFPLVNDVFICFQTFLFITTKKVVGCSVAVQIDQVCLFHFSLKFLANII